MTVPFTDGGGSSGVPARALFLSLLALAVPVMGMVVFPGWIGEEAGVLLWLTALVPPFLLTYHRGWVGSSLGLAGGMAALAIAHLLLELLQVGVPNYTFLLWITATFIAVCVGIGVLAEVLKRERRKAEEMALTDVLTGLPNRRHAGVFLDAAFSAAVRGQPVSVVLFDLDNFKEVNDTHGHKAGDDVLRDLGEILSTVTRRMDLSARWGGEEFLSILSECDAEGAVVFVERVQEKLRSAAFKAGRITASAGIAQYGDGMGSPELLVAAADQALYQAKGEGKDCWRVSGEKAGGETGPRAAPPADPTAHRGEGGRELSQDGTARPAPLTQEADSFVDGPREREEPEDPEKLPGGWERILLVDDDAAAREAIGKILRRLGYMVVEADSGEAGLEKAGNMKELDLLVTDLIMPGMSGFTLGEKVEKILGPRRILYMSGYVQREVVWDGAPGAQVEFLEKPMRAGELARKIRDLLDRPVDGVVQGASERKESE